MARTDRATTRRSSPRRSARPSPGRADRLRMIVIRHGLIGLVGVLGFPVLMDGGSVTAPNLAIFTDDGYIVEKITVKPNTITVAGLKSEVSKVGAALPRPPRVLVLVPLLRLR